MRRLLTLVAMCSLASGCVARAMFTDGTSVSLGRPNRGVLRGGHALPTSGAGYVVPGLWVARGAIYGTDELLGAIQSAARKVSDKMPGGVLGVGDLSRRGGGDMGFHRSHESGRDADLIFYAVDDDGQPVEPPQGMPRYRGGRHLRAREPYETPPTPISRRYFDMPRNWLLVRSLVEDPTIDVEYLFISERLREKMIDYARTIGEPPEVVHRAAVALRQPVGALPHDDHLHLRIRCTPTDAALGCVEEGAVRLRSEIYRGESPPRPRPRMTKLHDARAPRPA